MFLSRLKGRWPIILVVAVVGFAVAAVTHHSLITTLTSIGVVLLVFGFLERRVGPDESSSHDPARFNAEPFTFHFAWSLTQKPELGTIEDRLAVQGMTPERDESANADLVMRGGSHLWTRLFGGFFVSLDRLPMRAEVTLSKGTGAVWKLDLQISDRLGLAIRDATRERRFKMAAERIKDPVEKSLKEHGEQVGQ
jgi:hypothetical protein